MKSILTVIGTRPEAIKLFPLLDAISKNKRFKNEVCVTGQHTDLLYPFLANLKIPVNYHFENNKQRSTLHQSAANILEQFGPVFEKSKPDLVVVQGDTTTAFIAALAAFYSCLPIAHIEAGLRTGHLHSPWPEEGHRYLISKLATYFFTPTLQAKETLILEGVSSEKIWVVGNTSIDAIRLARKPQKPSSHAKSRNIVVTVHRRENHGEPLIAICQALSSITELFQDIQIKFLLHPNPAVHATATRLLSGIKNIDLIEPMDHPSFIQLLDESTFIITDSGGIQEEATFMGKPVLITRTTTERTEGIEAGTARLVGTKTSHIVACCKELLEKPDVLTAMSKVHLPYGDGYAAEQILNIFEKVLWA